MTATVNANTTSGVVVTSDTSGALALQTANTTALTISSGQIITASGSIGIGGTTPSGGGVGIAFPATQSTSTDANTLDDYEEGTWTPTVTSSNGAITSYTSSGSYTKIGNSVTVNFRFTITNNGTGTTGIIVSNFIFPAKNTNTIAGGSREDTIVGFTVGASPNTTTSIYVTNSAGTYPGGTGYAFSFCITYLI